MSTPGPSPSIAPERHQTSGEYIHTASQWYLMIFIIMTSVGIVAPIIFCVLRKYCSLPPIPQRPQFISYRVRQGNFPAASFHDDPQVVRVPLKTVDGIIVLQPNSCEELATFGEPIDVSKHKRDCMPGI